MKEIIFKTGYRNKILYFVFALTIVLYTIYLVSQYFISIALALAMHSILVAIIIIFTLCDLTKRKEGSNRTHF